MIGETPNPHPDQPEQPEQEDLLHYIGNLDASRDALFDQARIFAQSGDIEIAEELEHYGKGLVESYGDALNCVLNGERTHRELYKESFTIKENEDTTRAQKLNELTETDLFSIPDYADIEDILVKKLDDAENLQGAYEQWFYGEMEVFCIKLGQDLTNFIVIILEHHGQENSALMSVPEALTLRQTFFKRAREAGTIAIGVTVALVAAEQINKRI